MNPQRVWLARAAALAAQQEGKGTPSTWHRAKRQPNPLWGPFFVIVFLIVAIHWLKAIL